MFCWNTGTIFREPYHLNHEILRLVEDMYNAYLPVAREIPGFSS